MFLKLAVCFQAKPSPRGDSCHSYQTGDIDPYSLIVYKEQDGGVSTGGDGQCNVSSCETTRWSPATSVEQFPEARLGAIAFVLKSRNAPIANDGFAV